MNLSETGGNAGNDALTGQVDAAAWCGGGIIAFRNERIGRQMSRKTLEQGNIAALRRAQSEGQFRRKEQFRQRNQYRK